VDRRHFLLTSLAGALAVPLAAEAQQAGMVYRVGIIHLTSSTPPVEAFRNTLRDLGWLEGQTLIIDYRGADGKAERLEDLAAEIITSRPDVIVTGTSGAAVADTYPGTSPGSDRATILTHLDVDAVQHSSNRQQQGVSLAPPLGLQEVVEHSVHETFRQRSRVIVGKALLGFRIAPKLPQACDDLLKCGSTAGLGRYQIAIKGDRLQEHRDVRMDECRDFDRSHLGHLSWELPPSAVLVGDDPEMIRERHESVPTGHLHVRSPLVRIREIAEAGPIFESRKGRVMESPALSRNTESPAIPRFYCVATGEEVEEEGELGSRRHHRQVLVPAMGGGDVACECLALRITWALKPTHEGPVFPEG
jgi:hypothetical protein